MSVFLARNSFCHISGISIERNMPGLLYRNDVREILTITGGKASLTYEVSPGRPNKFLKFSCGLYLNWSEFRLYFIAPKYERG